MLCYLIPETQLESKWLSLSVLFCELKQEFKSRWMPVELVCYFKTSIVFYKI